MADYMIDEISVSGLRKLNSIELPMKPDGFELIIDTLKAAFPDFDNLGFPPVAAGMLTMCNVEEIR